MNAWSVSTAAIFLLVLGACDPPPPDVDAGRDAGADVDAGVDESDAGPVDAGPIDAGPVDAGPPCDGPPGLYIEGSCSVLAPGVRPFVVNHVLWTDDADKERYIFLPPGTQIDTSDPDNWVFPVGTRIYKTFLHDGVRLETRLMEKTALDTGPAAWDMIPYAWNAEQNAVTDVGQEPFAIRENALGTDHDIPSSSECIQCHSGSLDVINGFSAIQLNHDMGGVTLTTLNDESLLSAPIATADADIPGDDATVAALGYLHANCGHCHRYTQFDPNASICSPIGSDNCGTCAPAITQPCGSGFLAWLRVSDVTAEDTDTYQTAVGVAAGNGGADPDIICRVHPGAPATSRIVERMERRDFDQMPPMGTTEFVDEDGAAIVSAWITGATGSAANCVQ